MTTPCAVHDRVAKDLLVRLFCDARVDGRDPSESEILVILESLLLGAMVVTERRFATPRRLAVEQLEMMVERVETRLGAIPVDDAPTVRRPT